MGMFSAFKKKGAVDNTPKWMKEEKALAERKRERVEVLQANRASKAETASSAAASSSGIIEDAAGNGGADSSKKADGAAGPKKHIRVIAYKKTKRVKTKKGGAEKDGKKKKNPDTLSKNATMKVNAMMSNAAAAAKVASVPSALLQTAQQTPVEALSLLKEASNSDLRKLRQHHSYGSGVHKKSKNNKFANGGGSSMAGLRSLEMSAEDTAALLAEIDARAGAEGGAAEGAADNIINNRVNIYSKKNAYGHLQNSIDAFVEKAHEGSDDSEDDDDGEGFSGEEGDESDDDDDAASVDSDGKIIGDHAKYTSNVSSTAINTGEDGGSDGEGGVDGDRFSYKKNNNGSRHKSKPFRMTKYSRRVGSKIKSSHEDRNKRASFNKERGVQFRVNKGARRS